MSSDFNKTSTDLGMKVGDKFVAGEGNSAFKVGTIVTLVSDDHSRCPLFKDAEGKKLYAYAEAMTPLKAEVKPGPLTNFIIDVSDVETTVRVGKILGSDQLKRIIEILGE